MKYDALIKKLEAKASGGHPDGARQDDLAREAADAIVLLQSELTATRKALEGERERCAKFEALLNTPELSDFPKAVQIEAAHQRERWGDEHDRTKHAHDWVAVLTHLIGKATKAFWDGDIPKLKHHIITTAAVCNNWHARILEAESALPAPQVKK